MTGDVLFLCTGNYFRSRYAEILFNHRAAALGLSARASSRGLSVTRKNPGPISRHALERLTAAGLVTPELTRSPAQVTEAELAAAGRIIALKEAEHRALVAAHYPAFTDRVEYWHVDDIDCSPPTEALELIDVLVEELLTPRP